MLNIIYQKGRQLTSDLLNSVFLNWNHSIEIQVSLKREEAVGLFGLVRAMSSIIARFMGPKWGPSGADRTQVGPMVDTWALLLGLLSNRRQSITRTSHNPVRWGLTASLDNGLKQKCIWAANINIDTMLQDEWYSQTHLHQLRCRLVLNIQNNTFPLSTTGYSWKLTSVVLEPD